MKKICLIATLLALSACAAPEPNTQSNTETQDQPSPTETIEPTTEPESTDAPEPTVSQSLVPLTDTQTTPPEIDGRFNPGEWDAASRTALNDGATVYWLYTNGHLYAAIDQTIMGAANLAIERQPGELWIMHASAALGSLIYEQDGETWAKVQDWNWCCRSFTDTAPVDALYEAEGWRSKVTSAGVPGKVEFMLEIEPGSYQTAISFLFADNSGDIAWYPSDLSEEAYKQLQGPFPNEITFLLNEWITITIEE